MRVDYVLNVYEMFAVLFKDRLTRNVDGVGNFVDDDLDIGKQSRAQQNFELRVFLGRQRELCLIAVGLGKATDPDPARRLGAFPCSAATALPSAATRSAG